MMGSRSPLPNICDEQPTGTHLGQKVALTDGTCRHRRRPRPGRHQNLPLSEGFEKVTDALLGGALGRVSGRPQTAATATNA